MNLTKKILEYNMTKYLKETIKISPINNKLIQNQTA